MYRVENVCLRESDIRESVVIFIHVLVKCLLESQMLYLYIHVRDGLVKESDVIFIHVPSRKRL